MPGIRYERSTVGILAGIYNAPRLRERTPAEQVMEAKPPTTIFRPSLHEGAGRSGSVETDRGADVKHSHSVAKL